MRAFDASSLITVSRSRPKKKGESLSASSRDGRLRSVNLVSYWTGNARHRRNRGASALSNTDRSRTVAYELDDARLVIAERAHNGHLVRVWRGILLKAVQHAVD